MNDIKQVIAKNLISLRKKHHLTQNELAEKLNYSDNAISRWEHAEVTPSIETLEQIANIYNVPLTSLIEDNAVKTAQLNDKRQLVNKLAGVLITASIVWFMATIIFVMARLIWDYTFWQIYIWSIPIVAVVMMPFHHYWGRHIYKFTILTILLHLLSIFNTLLIPKERSIFLASNKSSAIKKRLLAAKRRSFQAYFARTTKQKPPTQIGGFLSFHLFRHFLV